MMDHMDQLTALRLARWRQTAQTRLAGPEDAARLIEQVGIATLYPVSPEIPNLFCAYLGDPEAATDSGHDTPSGEVYTWRWVLGRRDAAFYSALVRGRPTWVSWALLPAALRLWGESRAPADLYAAGVLSADAARVARALEAAGGALGTGELRRQAGFPTGKSQRAAYLRAVQELDRLLLLAKVFAAGDGEPDMHHALVRARYPEHVAAAEQLTRDEALDAVLATYLASAVYALPGALAKQLSVPEPELRAGLDRLVATGRATLQASPSERADRYLWREA
jgi:hypothetical protein